VWLKFPNTCSIFTAEAFAISHALEIIEPNQINKAVILSDSLALTSITNFHQLNCLFKKIPNQITSLYLTSQTINFIWITSYIGIQGNELTDTYAKRDIVYPASIKINSLPRILRRKKNQYLNSKPMARYNHVLN